MKKFLSLLLAGIMIFSCMLAFSSCVARPEKDLDDARDNLEDEDYIVSYSDDSDQPGYEEYLYARNDKDDTLTVIIFSDTKLAGMYYDEMKAQIQYEKETIKREIKALEHMLKKYDDDMDSDEVDEMEDEIKDLKKELKEYDEIVIGKSGKTVWMGTKDAIKDSKG